MSNDNVNCHIHWLISIYNLFPFLGVAPPPLQVSFSRPTSLHEQQQQQHHLQQQQQQQLESQQQQQHAYADAYAALGRGQYESTTRAPNNSKVWQPKVAMERHKRPKAKRIKQHQQQQQQQQQQTTQPKQQQKQKPHKSNELKLNVNVIFMLIIFI